MKKWLQVAGAAARSAIQAGWALLARRPPVLITVAAIGVVALLLLLLGPVAWWAMPAKHLQGKDKAEALNATRQTLLAAAAGTAVLAGLVFAAQTFYLTRRGQLTDRYTKAITLLASDKLSERIGGVYALEHLMVESDRDHATVVDVLAAFIRERAPARGEQAESLGPFGAEYFPTPPADARDRPDPATDPLAAFLGERAPAADAQDRPKPATDVQAALTVLGRRPDRPERNRIDLTATDLRGADLHGARLQGADLSGSQLQRTRLRQAQLQRATLRRAQLQNANLVAEQLRGAHLYYAQLQGAWAQLQGADLGGARLQGRTWAGRSFTARTYTGRSSRARTWAGRSSRARTCSGRSSRARAYAGRSSRARTYTGRSSRARFSTPISSNAPHKG